MLELAYIGKGDDSMLELYKNIKEKRKELGISQDELAKRVGYSGKSMISKIEKGEVDLSTTMIKKFSKALDTAPSELLGDPIYENDTTMIEKQADSSRTAKALELYSQYESSIPEIQKAVENLLRASQSDK